MKSRLSRIILSILILSLALQAFTFPVLAHTEPTESQAGIEIMPSELAAPYRRLLETTDRPEYIPPSPEIIAKTKAQVSNFECTDDMDVPKIECQALVDLYSLTNGAGWTNNTNWLQNTAVSTWHGVMVDNGVTQLHLYDNQLNGSIPSSLGNLSNLIYLFLHDNQLTGSIPPTLGNLSNLHGLNLYGNQLTGSIPSTLGNLSNLHTLYLFDNQLTGSIPPTLGNLSDLQYLFLHNNRLTGSIPLSFVNLTNLLIFSITETNLCEPNTPEFLAWKNTVETWYGTGVICKQICLPLIFR